MLRTRSHNVRRLSGMSIAAIPGASLDAGWPLDQPFTMAQATSGGLSRDVIARLTRQGVLRRVLKGVYVDAALPDSLQLRSSALSLVVPESAIVTDRTAAWLHGVSVLAANDHLRAASVSLFQLPGHTRVRTRGNVGGERTLLDTDIELVGGIRVTTPLRTALDLGRLTSRDDAIGCLDALLRLGRFTQRELLTELPRFRGFRGVVQLRRTGSACRCQSGVAPGVGSSAALDRRQVAGAGAATVDQECARSQGVPRRHRLVDRALCRRVRRRGVPLRTRATSPGSAAPEVDR